MSKLVLHMDKFKKEAVLGIQSHNRRERASHSHLDLTMLAVSKIAIFMQLYHQTIFKGIPVFPPITARTLPEAATLSRSGPAGRLREP